MILAQAPAATPSARPAPAAPGRTVDPVAGPRSAEAHAERPMMGGLVVVHAEAAAGTVDARRVDGAADAALDRLEAWASRLTRFDAASELSRLNASPATDVPVGPTLTSVLDWAREAESLTGGLVDVAMLEARLAAEDGTEVLRPLRAGRRWSLTRHARGAVLHRDAGVRFDLDGVAKGWLADRALALLLAAAPRATALVDGDGDVAARVAPGGALHVGIADPRTDGETLAIVRLAADGDRPERFGLATSGTSVHRWTRGGAAAHHLIDPATWRPAETDVVQATVLARTARAAEAYAKAALIAGSDRAAERLARPDVLGVLLLTTRGEIRATPGMLAWLS